METEEPRITPETNSSFSSATDDVSSEEEDASDTDLMNIRISVRSNVGTFTPLVSIFPKPLPQKFWNEPSASSFKLRGAEYMKNRKKIPSGENLFRLFAVDLVQVSELILSGMCNHPNERVQRGLRAEKEGIAGSKMPPFIFCVNITVPGKPAHHIVVYYAVDDISLIKPPASGSSSASPFNRLASKFFFGYSDVFRQSTFKLIPRIAKGNFLVKNAVGSKPVVLGKRMKNHYIRNERFFELIIDVASNPIAKRVVSLSAGYAKTLVVDMGFVLEGKNKAMLPESMMGTVRLNNVDLDSDLRFVEQP